MRDARTARRLRPAVLPGRCIKAKRINTQGGRQWHALPWLREARVASATPSPMALKNKGYHVAANYAGNDDAAQKFQAETGIPVYKWDVGDYDACAGGSSRSRSDLGPIDVLVNNAGITRDAMFHRMTTRAVERGDQHQSQLALQHDPAGVGRACATASSAASSASPPSTARRARWAR